MGLLASGRNPAALKTSEKTVFVATAGQTQFNIQNQYVPGNIEVHMNGILLVEAEDYYATDGYTVNLISAAAGGESIIVTSQYNFVASGHYTKAEADSRYMVATGLTPMQSYLRTPNYGISSWSDSSSASLEASQGSGTAGVGIKAWGRSMSTYGGEITYTTDSRGPNLGGHKFYSWNGSSQTKIFEVKSNGVSSTPAQPAMFITGTQGGYAARDGSGFVPFNYIMGGISDGGISTGLWTCQNSGTYLISQYTLIQSASAFESRILKNGAIMSRAYNSSGRSTSSTIVLNMSVGDYIQWFCDYDVYLHQTSQYSGLCIVKVG